MKKGFQQGIESVRGSIVALGFHPEQDKITIVGSGFCAGDKGKIITTAHIYNQLTETQREGLKANVMVRRDGDLEWYEWMAIRFLNKNDRDDIAIFEFVENKDSLVSPLVLGDSEESRVGDDTYFIGFPYAAQLINEGYGITLIVNKGIISNIKRDGVSDEHPRSWFIVDAISNPGMSGAPLVDILTNKVIGVMSTAFRAQSQVMKELDIREPMHIAGAKPINPLKELLGQNK